jgi:hypothetical protein
MQVLLRMKRQKQNSCLALWVLDGLDWNGHEKYAAYMQTYFKAAEDLKKGLINFLFLPIKIAIHWLLLRCRIFPSLR